MQLFFSFPGGMEWIIIFLGILLLFGGRKIPELMKGIGKGIREFNSAKDKVRDSLEEGMKEGDQKSSSKEDDSSKDNKTNPSN